MAFLRKRKEPKEKEYIIYKYIYYRYIYIYIYILHICIYKIKKEFFVDKINNHLYTYIQRHKLMPKEKLTLYLEHDMIGWLDSKTNPELKVSAVVRNLIRDKMNAESRRKAKKNPFSTGLDPFSFYVINKDVIPDDLKEYADLLIEWWPIRKKKGGSCTTSVAERIFKKLRSFPTQDRKQALENAIAGGWKDLFPLKQSYKPEEPEFKPRYFKASDADLPPTLAEMGKTAKEMMEGNK